MNPDLNKVKKILEKIRQLDNEAHIHLFSKEKEVAQYICQVLVPIHELWNEYKKLENTLIQNPKNQKRPKRKKGTLTNIERIRHIFQINNNSWMTVPEINRYRGKLLVYKAGTRICDMQTRGEVKSKWDKASQYKLYRLIKNPPTICLKKGG